jgi:hypothetical protein
VNATYRGEFGELVAEVERIDVTSALPQPNQDWRFTDEHGHEHYWQNGYPTLTAVPDGEPYYCGDCSEEHQDTKRVCALCGVDIVPGTVVDTFRRYVPGRASYWLNGEPIREDQAQALIEEMRRVRTRRGGGSGNPGENTLYL